MCVNRVPVIPDDGERPTSVDWRAHMVAHGGDLNIMPAVGTLDRGQEARIHRRHCESTDPKTAPPGASNVTGPSGRASSQCDYYMRGWHERCGKTASSPGIVSLRRFWKEEG